RRGGAGGGGRPGEGRRRSAAEGRGRATAPRARPDCLPWRRPGRMGGAMKLTGRVTWVTNVSQYMGPACVEEFAKEGAILVLHERTEARAQPAVDVGRADGRETLVLTGDL